MLQIKKLHEDAKIPTRGSEFSIGLDLYALEQTMIESGTRKLVKTGIAIAIPENYYGRIAPRSGLAVKGLDVCAGVIDRDYRGEVKVLLSVQQNYFNFVIEKGDKIAQLILEKADVLQIEVVEELDETKRGEGGFGSTGK